MYKLQNETSFSYYFQELIDKQINKQKNLVTLDHAQRQQGLINACIHNMYMCVYVYMYACMYVCVHVCMHVCMYVHIFRCL